MENHSQNPQPVRFEDLHRVHILGIAGTLMGAFASFLKRKGIEVTGSDQNVYPPMSDVLAQAKIPVFTPYDSENLKKIPGRPDLIVVGNVISSTNPEMKAVVDSGIPYGSLPEAMEKLLLKETTNLVVAGTHGKTTTSSILAYVLKASGRDPNYFIGGVSPALPHSFQVSSLEQKRPFVLEGDEYDTAFWDKVPKFFHYLPDHVILTSVEFDHADIYADLAAVEQAFEGLVSRIRPGGHLIACVETAPVRRLLARAQVPVVTYGRARLLRAEGVTADFEIQECQEDPAHGMMTFRFVETASDHSRELSLRLPGEHNALNALSVWIETQRLGLTDQEVSDGLMGFEGVKRRQEVRGEKRGVTVIDDFAHHPTAVRETLGALRSRYPGRRLIAVFEPRSATSRRRVFQEAYVDAFVRGADQIWIAQAFDQSKIPVEQQFSSGQLVADLVAQAKDAQLIWTVEEGVRDLSRAARAGDVIAVLSNGGFGGFIPKLLEALNHEIQGG